MSDGRGTVRQRIVGKRLRQMREERGLTIEAAAVGLEISASRLSRIETARQGVEVHIAKSMLDLYDIGGDRWNSTLDLVREARKKRWWQRFPLGAQYNYVRFEADAVLVQEYASGYVPGILQVPDYAVALYQSSLTPRTPEVLAAEIELRMLRQRRLSDPADLLRFVGIVDEEVLHNPIGGPDVLRAQLAHLVELVALPTVTLQVLPRRSGAHASLESGFFVLSFGDLGEPDMAFVEHALGALQLDRPDEVQLARNKFDQLRTMALGPEESLALLREVAAAT
ncbi:helix-turn-helix domain-containing protein [Pseudonocardia sp. CA-107938]|uniref:helix-turn-helix domain-containing protein n=1 Tax=Pseudonocardia sp. CA-107938 TaxID=3240021 RepID=UPI003D8B1937